MKVVICGAGLVGYSIASYLIEEGNEVTVIDNDPVLVSKINDTLDCRGLLGHASSPSALEKAGIEDADMIIAVTREDEVNMLACSVAHTLFDVPKKIARIREQSYLKPQWNRMFSNEGIPIDLIISPEREVAEAIIRRIRATGATDVIPMCDESVNLIGVVVQDGSIVLNSSIARLLAEYDDLKMNVMVIIRDENIIVPGNDTILQVNDEVYFVCDATQVRYGLALFGHESDEDEQHRLLLIGGGNIGAYLAIALEDEINIRVIEKDSFTARKLSEKIPNTVIINGDALDSSILDEAGIHQNDICISVTNDDETNLLISLLSKNAGIDRVISLINNPSYMTLTKKLGVDVTVDPREITASIILENIRHGVVKSLYSLQNNHAEVLEIEVEAGASITDLPLKDVVMPRKTTIGFVKRGDEMFVPKFDTVLEAGDRVILLTVNKYNKKIINLFTPTKESY